MVSFCRNVRRHLNFKEDGCNRAHYESALVFLNPRFILSSTLYWYYRALSLKQCLEVWEYF